MCLLKMNEIKERNIIKLDYKSNQVTNLWNSFVIVCRRGANFTGTSIVHVKYAREIADCYGQNVIMKWFDLISESLYFFINSCNLIHNFLKN